jgi:hypothetical protein
MTLAKPGKAQEFWREVWFFRVACGKALKSMIARLSRLTLDLPFGDFRCATAPFSSP